MKKKRNSEPWVLGQQGGEFRNSEAQEESSPVDFMELSTCMLTEEHHDPPSLAFGSGFEATWRPSG